MFFQKMFEYSSCSWDETWRRWRSKFNSTQLNNILGLLKEYLNFKGKSKKV